MSDHSTSIGTDIAYELEALAGCLLREAPRGFTAEQEEEYQLRLRLRSMGIRLAGLSQALLTVLDEGDVEESVRSAAATVYGEVARG